MRGLRLVQNGEGADQPAMTVGVGSLRNRVARGEYVVDEHAVAEAMLSRVLVSAQLFDLPAARSRKGHAGSGLDAAEPGNR